MSYTYKYPRPTLTVDAIVFRKNPDSEILLIQRSAEPYENMWAFPGGFVDMDETAEQAVVRELYEETALKEINLKQFHTFSDVNRDPRHRTITIAFGGFMNEILNPNAGDDARQARWFPLSELPKLAFDHGEILEKFLKEKFIEKCK